MTKRTSVPLADLHAPHSGLCDVGRLVRVTGGKYVRQECTCGAGLVRLMRGES